MSESLTVTWNAQYDASVGDIPSGYALTKTAAGKFVVATTANRAVWSDNWVFAVSLDAGRGDQTVRAAHQGYVQASTFGYSLGATGRYVNVQADGTLTRSASITADTVGIYQIDGSIIVDLLLSVGGAVTGNATAIQGVSVSSASASRGQHLVADGTSIRAREDVPDFRDWSPVADGVTDQSALLQLAFNDVFQRSNRRKLRVNPPANRLGYRIAQTVTAYDDTDGGNAREFVLDGYPGEKKYGDLPTFVCGVTCPSGSAASVTSYYSGTGQATQVWSLGASSGVTVALKEQFIGQQFVAWNPTDILNCGEFIIVGVPADNQITVYNPRAGATGTDANNGAIRWRIYLPTFDVRAGSWLIQGVGFYSATGRWGAQLNIGQPFRAGGTGPNGFTVRQCNFSGASTWVTRYGMQIACEIVPRGGSGYSADSPFYTGRNGNGDLQVVQTVQVDEGLVEENKFLGLDSMGVRHSSGNGQSKSIVFRRNTYAQGGRGSNYGMIGYGQPRIAYSPGPAWNVEGNPQSKHVDTIPGAIDLVFLVGGSSSGGVKCFEGTFSEAASRLAVVYGTGLNPTVFRDTQMTTNVNSLHLSKEMIDFRSDGPLYLDMLHVVQADNVGAHIQVRSTSSKTALCVATAVCCQGVPGWVGRRARREAGRPGPYKVLSTDDLQISVNGGTTRTIGRATANNLARIAQSTADVNELESWQMGRLLNGGPQGTGRAQNAAYDVGAVIQTATGRTNSVTYVVTGAGTTANVSDPSAAWSVTPDVTFSDGTVTLIVSEGFNAWGEWDNYPPSIQSMTNGTGGSIQVVGGTLQTLMDWSGLITYGQVQTQICIDTNGLFDLHPGAGAGTEPVSHELVMLGGVCTPTTYSGTHLPMPNGITRYGTTHTVYNETRTAAGGSFTACASGGPAKALTLAGGNTTISGAVVSSAANDIRVDDPRCTPRSLVTVHPTNAAAVTLGVPFEVDASRAAGTFKLTFPGPPAGTETYRYSITEPT
jgi:hypothetical protein